MIEDLREDPQPDGQDITEEQDAGEQDIDELEQKLLDAVRALSRKTKRVEEYLDSLGRKTEKPADEPAANSEPPKN